MVAQASSDTGRPPRVHREVVSFVRRSARMRSPQREAWERHSAAYVIDIPRRETSTSVHPDARIDLARVFGRTAPLVVEVGPGTGESLIPLAEARPETNVLAFEVYQPAVAQILMQIGRRGLSNIRLVEADAMAGLRHLLPPDSVDELWTFFPDPWPKVKHHKRRLVSAEFAEVVAARLKPGGRWRLATDWADYADQMQHVLADCPHLTPDHEGPSPRWPDRPVTRFERRGIQAGRAPIDFSCTRV